MLTCKKRSLAIAIEQGVAELRQKSDVIQTKVVATATEVAAARADIAANRNKASHDKNILASAIDQGVTGLSQKSDATHTKVIATATEVAATRADVAANRAEELRINIVQWLSSTDHSSNHYAAIRKHQPTTGGWVIRMAEFENWKQTQNSFLWLHGKRKFQFFKSLTCYIQIYRERYFLNSKASCLTLRDML